MYNGQDYPQCIIRDTIYSLPSPIANSRAEFPYDIETEYYTNLKRQNVRGETVIYFGDTYLFSDLSESLFNILINAMNEGLTVIWIPYSDRPSLRFKSNIIDVRDIPVNGTSRFKNVKVQVRGIDNLKKIPTTDNMYQVQNFKLIRL